MEAEVAVETEELVVWRVTEELEVTALLEPRDSEDPEETLAVDSDAEDTELRLRELFDCELPEELAVLAETPVTDDQLERVEPVERLEDELLVEREDRSLQELLVLTDCVEAVETEETEEGVERLWKECSEAEEELAVLSVSLVLSEDPEDPVTELQVLLELSVLNELAEYTVESVEAVEAVERSETELAEDGEEAVMNLRQQNSS